jgi:MFS family permease
MPKAAVVTTTSPGYLDVLRANRNFRRLWYGQIVSQLGDWLDNIALFTLLLKLTGSGQAVGLLFLVEFLPGAIIGPFAGVLVDRLPRKLVLIASDIVRAAVVLLFLLVDGPEDLWLLYSAVAVKFTMAAFFEPARSAIIPSICRREELVAANAISGATWSAMLALGAAIGGLVAGTLGVQAAFLLDAASFLLSALLIATVRVAGTGQSAGAEARTATSLGVSVGAVLGELREGFGYVLRHYEVAWLTFTKALWSLGGGVLLLLTLFGRELFPLGRDGAISIGLLYAARGIGTFAGPFVALRLGGDGEQFLRRAIGVAFAITGVGYMLSSGAPTLAVAALCIFFAHTGGSIQWVFSTALLQARVPNRLLGRVFATEFASFTLTTALSAYAVGVAHDMGFSPRTLTLICGVIFVVCGLVLGVALWRGRPALAATTQD